MMIKVGKRNSNDFYIMLFIGESNPSPSEASPVKKKAYSIAKDKLELIQEDTLNKKIWDEILSSYENFTVSYTSQIHECKILRRNLLR